MKSIASILLVEDDEGDILLTNETFNEGNFESQLAVIKDGQQAIKYLKKEDQFYNRTTAHIILLDLNLPRMNGLKVLKFIKTDQQLKVIPVIILTTSISEKDISQSYE